MKKEENHIIEKELDKILEKFDNGGFNVQNFINYSRILNQATFENLGLHRKSRECVFPNCTKQSIKKSHSIPKTTSLLNIASNGHLLKPEYDLTNKDTPLIKMYQVGIKNASVFPGYCEEHENVFKSFEQDGKMDDEKKALLQTYRAICRERVFREIEIEITEKARSVYQKKINEEALSTIKESLLKQHQSSKIDSVEIKGIDSVLYSLEGLNLNSIEINNELLDFENKVFQHIYHTTKKNELVIQIVNIDIKFPISLCGFATLKYIEKSNENTAYQFLNVLPQKESTNVICVGLEKDDKICGKFCELSLSDPLNLLNMIESFMVNGSDHWFISPDYWAKMPKQKQDKILYDILATEDSFIDEYPISIFDDIRSNILSVFKENTKHRELTNEEKARINIEMQKLKREDYKIIRDDDRLYERMEEKIKH